MNKFINPNTSTDPSPHKSSATSHSDVCLWTITHHYVMLTKMIYAFMYKIFSSPLEVIMLLVLLSMNLGNQTFNLKFEFYLSTLFKIKMKQNTSFVPSQLGEMNISITFGCTVSLIKLNGRKSFLNNYQKDKNILSMFS